MRPITRPRAVMSSARTSPLIWAFSPITSPTLRTSPSTTPSIWMSPFDTRVPVTVRSALMIEGAVLRPTRLGGNNGAAEMLGAGIMASLLLENMAACLYEIARVAYDIIIPDLIMNMRAGAAAGGPHAPDNRALAHLGAHRHGNLGKMTIACMHAKTMVDFHHVAVTAAISCKNHHARRGRGDRGAPRAGEIQAWVKGVMA